MTPPYDWFVSMLSAYYQFSLPFFLLANGTYLLILILGYFNARRQYAYQSVGIMDRLAVMRSVEPISVLVPCYNEERVAVDSIKSMLALDYPEFEVIVCNDGSRDRTLEVLKQHFELYEIHAHPPQQIATREVRTVFRSRTHGNLLVIDKVNGGNADALNAAINYSQYPLICCVDSDSIIDADGLRRVAMPFLSSDLIIATGGTILTIFEKNDANSTIASPGIDKPLIPWTWMGMIQSMEYLRAFMVGRLGWDFLRSDMIISGAFGLFKKSLVIQVGGYLTNTIGEDMELLLRMQRYCLQTKRRYIVKLLPDPVCWTEAPSDLRTLRNQRVRWAQGLAESLWANRRLFFRSWSGQLGWVGAPYFLLFELLSAPVELLGYALMGASIVLGVADFSMIAALLAVTVLFGCVLNLAAVLIDQLTFEKYKNVGDLGRLTLAAFAEHFGFRQVHLYWRVSGIVRWLRGKHSWGDMRRAGLKPAA